MVCPKCKAGKAGAAGCNSHCHFIYGGLPPGSVQTCAVGPSLHPGNHVSGGSHDHGPILISAVAAKPFKAMHQVRFVAVFHRWHVSSKGFEVVELAAHERKAAEQEAALLCRDRQGFYAVDFTLVELESGERLPRKLTWRERLTGWACNA